MKSNVCLGIAITCIAAMMIQSAMSQTGGPVETYAASWSSILIGPDGRQLPSGDYQLITPKSDGSTPDYRIITIGGTPSPVPPTPNPTPTPTPVVGMKTLVENAYKAVPDYADKVDHAKGIAFSIGFFNQMIVAKSKKPVAETIEVFNSTLLGVTQNNPEAWKPFFQAISTKLLECKSSEQLAASYDLVKQGLESQFPVSADDEGEVYEAVPTYGLMRANPEFWAFLKEMFMQVLPILLELLVA